MTEKPIIMSAPMVKAILREIEKPGTGKTQTRRMVKLANELADNHRNVRVRLTRDGLWILARDAMHTPTVREPFVIPLRWAAGDRLWVREAWANVALPGYPPVIFYAADDDKRPGHATPPGTKWKPSIHMRREFSRITLAVTEVRIERLQDISPDDAAAEGAVCDMSSRTFIDHYRNIWEAINGAGSWGDNPWVAAITFNPRLIHGSE